jgi:imidazolonepropionase-like amidohydrolase
MTERREYFIKADAILTADGLVRNKALHIVDGIIAGFPDNHLIDDTLDVLDYPGHIITPCFCDYHMHFFSHIPEDINAVATDLKASGITRVFEGGDKSLSGLQAKDQLKNNLDIKAAGCAIYKKGSYGQYIGKGVESIRGAKELINKLKKEGADYIKVINSGIFLPETGEISTGGFEARELKKIIRHAEDSGFKVACHTNGECAVREAVEAGASFIIHGLNVSDHTLSVMAEQGASLVPTVHAFASLKAVESKHEGARNIEKAVERQLSAVNSAYEKNVKILPGSDSGPAFIPCGVSFLEELKFFHKAGLDMDTIFKSAITGPFKKGMKADYLVMDGFDIKEVSIT